MVRPTHTTAKNLHSWI